MGWATIRYHLKEEISSLLREDSTRKWDPKQERYKPSYLKRNTMIGALFATAVFSMFAPTLKEIINPSRLYISPLSQVESQPSSKGTIKAEGIEFTLPPQLEPDTLPAQKIRSQPSKESGKKVDRKENIRRDLFNFIPGTNNLVCTAEGLVEVPDSNYTILAKGVNYFPDENNFIKLPKEVLGQKVRLTKMDLERKEEEGYGKYLASTPVTIKVAEPEEKFEFENFAKDSLEKSNSKTNLEESCQEESKNTGSKDLEAVCQKEKVFPPPNCFLRISPFNRKCYEKIYKL